MVINGYGTFCTKCVQLGYGYSSKTMIYVGILDNLSRNSWM